MAVQQNKVSRSKRNKRRTHDSLRSPALSTDQVSGEIHRRHHVTTDGFYKGRKVVETEQD